jgi:hypothetical protein
VPNAHDRNRGCNQGPVPSSLPPRGMNAARTSSSKDNAAARRTKTRRFRIWPVKAAMRSCRSLPAFAWCEPSRTLHFPSLFSVGLGPRSISAVAGAACQSDPHVSIHRRNHAMLSRFTGNGVLPSRVKDYASRPASAALASHSDNAALSSCAARDGAIGRHMWKYWPVAAAISGEDAR